MQKRLHQFMDHHKRSRQIIIWFSLDVLVLILAFLTAILNTKQSRLVLLILILIEIILILHTAMFCVRNLVVVNHLEEYFFKKSYGISAFKLQQFHNLLDENLFHYYFQPIINAKTGEIFAFEALMRTDPESIGMVPMEILDLAAKENRLYDIEKLTLFNTLKIMKEYPDVFQNKKLFINSISSCQLSDEDYRILSQEYSSLFQNLVIEMNDFSSLKEATLELIRNRINEMNCQLAFDECGIGYSIEPYLSKLQPNYIKIDRTLLRYINIDFKKQTLVSGLVNNAKQNNIMVIAEGIENYEELEYVAGLGIDYLQGFYAAKPGPELPVTITEELMHKIQKIHYKNFSDHTKTTVFETNGETELFPVEIASKNYSIILIFEAEVTLKGLAGEVAEIFLMIPDNHNCTIILDNLSLRSVDRPSIILGKNCTVELKLIGDNFLMNNGIRVPETSALTITGEGNLTLHSDRSNKIGIGGTDSQAYGNITLATSGYIDLLILGNICVGIGGGQNTANSVIHLISGNISVKTTGYTSVAIGNLLGNAMIEIGDCVLKVTSEGTKSIGVGSLLGSVDIVTSGNLELNITGRKAVAIGVLEDGTGNITIREGTLLLHFNAHTGTCLGSVSGTINIYQLNGDVIISGEGTEILGIGDHSGRSMIKISNGVITIRLLTSSPLMAGSLPQKIIIDGGNIQCDFPENITPVNSYGTPLIAHIITDTDDFSQLIETVTYRYEYKASYSPRYPYIKVYLPENHSIIDFQL